MTPLSLLPHILPRWATVVALAGAAHAIVAADEIPQPVEPVAPLERNTALSLARDGNHDLAALSWVIRGAEAQGLQAGKHGNPDLDVRLYQLAEQSGRTDVRRARVILSQPIELGGKRRRRVELAGAERELAERELELKRTAIAAEVRQRFTAVLAAQRRVEVLRRWLTVVDGMNEFVTAGVERGTLRSLEAHRIRSRVALERSDVQQAESQLAAVRLRLTSLWGNVTPRFTVAVGALEPTAALPDLETVLALAADGPASARWQAEQQRADAAVELAKANRFTDLSVGVGARWIEYGHRPDWLVDIGVELPVFDRRQGDFREAQFELSRVESKTRAEATRREAAIAEAYHALTAIDARRTALADQVIPSSRSLIDVYQKAFDAGATGYEELLDVRRDGVRAEQDHIDTLLVYHETIARLERLVGRSLPGFE